MNVHGNIGDGRMNRGWLDDPSELFTSFLQDDNSFFTAPELSSSPNLPHPETITSLAGTSSTSSCNCHIYGKYPKGSIDDLLVNMLHMTHCTPKPVQPSIWSPSVAPSEQRSKFFPLTLPPKPPLTIQIPPPPRMLERSTQIPTPPRMLECNTQIPPPPRMLERKTQVPPPPRMLERAPPAAPTFLQPKQPELPIQSEVRPIAGNPFPVVIKSSIGWNQTPIIEFGNDTFQDDKLCRPWGICCSKEGYIFVTDRRLDRIQVYKEDGSFVRSIGGRGDGPAQFYRPAGVTVDEQNRLIVVDKDNHRVQVLTMRGDFISCFGTLGSKDGQFHYPWDVATNRKCQIVVSDSRNSRIQLFSPTGQFLGKYGFDEKIDRVRYFNQPRGVAFDREGNILVTDFELHRLVRIRQDMTSAQIMEGGIGMSKPSFQRPQCIVVDDEGNIIVADTKNHQIQVLNCRGELRWTLGCLGTERGQMNRPAGVALTRSGRIAVVDFGNDRVMIF